MKNIVRALWARPDCRLAIGRRSPKQLTIATVNNGDMIRMQGLTDDFTEESRTSRSNG